MTAEDRVDLARLLIKQVQGIEPYLDPFGDRLLTDVALVDIRRQLAHLIRSIDERQEQAS